VCYWLERLSSSEAVLWRRGCSLRVDVGGS
jgi:hypothetical protein